MVCDKLLLGIRNNSPLLLRPCNDLFQGIADLLLADLLEIPAGCKDCSLVHQVLQVCSCEACMQHRGQHWSCAKLLMQISTTYPATNIWISLVYQRNSLNIQRLFTSPALIQPCYSANKYSLDCRLHEDHPAIADSSKSSSIAIWTKYCFYAFDTAP